MPKRLSLLLLSLVTSYWLLVPVVASAAIIPNCNPLPGHPPPEVPPSCTVNDLFVLLVNIYNFLLGMLAFVAVLFIIWMGVRMIIHYVSETPEQDLKDAKLGLSRAIWGIVLIAISWLVVNTVLVVLGVNPTSTLGCLLRQYGLLSGGFCP